MFNFAPLIHSEPTTLESFSRTIRNYVPSSIPIPSAGPIPPRISRPESFGSFLSPSRLNRASSQHAHESRGKRRGSEASHPSWEREYTPVFNLDEEVPEGSTRYPGLAPDETRAEEVLWAGWDSLVEDDAEKPRRLLILGYPSGLQIWDSTDLGAVSELLNLSRDWGAVVYAGVLPNPRLSSKDDPMREKRPLLGVVSETRGNIEFVVYSLRTHEVVKRLPTPGLRAFSASDNFIILSTSNPVNLHILSSSTFGVLYTIPSASLVPFASASPSRTRSSNINLKKSSNNPNSNVSHIDLDDNGVIGADRRPQHHHQHHHHYQHHIDTPRAVYAHSRRLLAFASPLTPAPAVAPGAHPNLHSAPAMLTESSPKFALGMSQAELGSAAIKLGGTVLSGMKSLGGLAISAARAGVSAAVAADGSGSGTGSEGPSGLSKMFFSRSAPSAGAGVGGAHQRRVSQPSSEGGRPDVPEIERERRAYIAPAPLSGGCNVTVVDLQPLLSSSSSAEAPPKRPVVVAEFVASKYQPVSCLRFSADGTRLVVSLKDGHSAKIYQLRPAPRVLRSPLSVPQVDEADSRQRHQRDESAVFDVPEGALEPPRHVYTLQRGRTSAVVEGLACAGDGRWVALATRKRTVHVFATNPYGGRTDDVSHLAGKVVNASELQPYPTELTPIVRLRTSKTPPPESCPAPLAFMFLRSSPSTLPSNLLPSIPPHYSTSSSPSSVHSASHANPLSLRTPRNLQDVLVFDPYDGTLSLCRIVVERSASSSDHTVGSVPVVGTTSTSLPGVSSLGRLSTSPASSGSPRRASGLSQMMERPAELVAKESRVGTWVLRRGSLKDWPEVRTAWAGERKVGRLASADWLSRAELSTCSSSPRILPRSIYLSHQFSFYVFGEDYHALIRSYRFDVPAKKIEVRKEVEVSAYAIDSGEAFVQGFQGTRDMNPVSSSFDEPLASAIQGDLPYLKPSPPVLPMYPNGTSGSGARSLRNAIPIRTVAGIGDTMSEGLGRLRREIGKVRSPRLAAREGYGLPESVPLEFAEEDEDFFVDARALPLQLESESMQGAAIDMMRSTSRGRGGDSGESLSLSTPSPNLEPLAAEDGMEGVWQGWEPEDQQAVEDAERFNDITVGFMDEEQETMREVARSRQALGFGGGKKPRKSRKR
ncbi:hypothetical protein BKA93DRAFT_917639 [Sparassis latifolia]